MSDRVQIQFSGHLIFDRFPSFTRADEFAGHVVDTYELPAIVSERQDDGIEPFPLQLDGPVVYVKRREPWDTDEEHMIEADVDTFGGTFAGT